MLVVNGFYIWNLGITEQSSDKNERPAEINQQIGYMLMPQCPYWRLFEQKVSRTINFLLSIGQVDYLDFVRTLVPE